VTGVSSARRGPVVFLVLTHKWPRLVERLVDRLGDTEAAIAVVHHDAEIAERPSLPRGGRALLMPERNRVQWGDPSFIRAELRCLRWIRDEIPDFSWIVLITGQDYPARPARLIEAELLDTSADAMIHWEFVPPFPTRRSSDWQRGTSHRYFRHRVPFRHRFVPPARRPFVRDGVGIFAGSAWCNLGSRAVDVLLEDTPTNEYLRERRFARAHVPDEAYFQTALLNASLGLTLVNRHRRFYRFSKAGGAAHPDILTVRDLEAIRASDAHFARKVEEGASAELLDRLDQLG
jgi:Core-2/I-Branching enzyme